MELFNNNIFLKFITHFKSSSSTTSQELRQQLVACTVVDSDDNCKFRFERAFKCFVLYMFNPYSAAIDFSRQNPTSVNDD